jgi:hypothetical protein
MGSLLVAGPLVKWPRTVDDNAGELIQLQKAEAQVQDMKAVALNLGPHVSKAATGVPSVVAVPSHRQTSVEIPEVTAALQASRVLRWQATIGDCCANATGLRKGATEWPLLPTVSCGSRPLLA